MRCGSPRHVGRSPHRFADRHRRRSASNFVAGSTVSSSVLPDSDAPFARFNPPKLHDITRRMHLRLLADQRSVHQNRGGTLNSPAGSQLRLLALLAGSFVFTTFLLSLTRRTSVVFRGAWIVGCAVAAAQAKFFRPVLRRQLVRNVAIFLAAASAIPFLMFALMKSSILILRYALPDLNFLPDQSQS
jgi:hypothetical protein